MARSIAAAESKVDMRFHSEPWHGEEIHNDDLKKKAAATSIVAVSAKARSFHSVAPHATMRSSRERVASPNPHIQIRASPLPKTNGSPEPPAATPLAVHTTKIYSHHRCHGARRRANQADHLPGPSPRHPSHETSPTVRFTVRKPWQEKPGISHRARLSATIVGAPTPAIPPIPVDRGT